MELFLVLFDIVDVVESAASAASLAVTFAVQLMQHQLALRYLRGAIGASCGGFFGHEEIKFKLIEIQMSNRLSLSFSSSNCLIFACRSATLSGCSNCVVNFSFSSHNTYTLCVKSSIAVSKSG
jgi:hypothetical protein